MRATPSARRSAPPRPRWAGWVAVGAAVFAFAACDTALAPFSGDGEWAALGAPTATPYALDLDADTLYVAAGHDGVFRADVSEPGRPFVPLGLDTEDTGGSGGVRDVDAHGGAVLAAASPRGLVFASGEAGAGVARSADGGRTWVRSDDGLRGDGREREVGTRIDGVARSPGDPDVVVASKSARSTDGGRTWAALKELVASPRGVVWSPGRAGEVWVFGSGVRFQAATARSADGGRTWSLSHVRNDPSEIDDLVVSAVDPDRVWAASVTVVFASDEGGADWERGDPARVLFRSQSRTDYCVALAGHSSGAVFAACGPDVFVAGAGGDPAVVERVPSPNGGDVSSLLYDAGSDALFVGAADGVYRLQAPLRAPRVAYDPKGWRRDP